MILSSKFFIEVKLQRFSKKGLFLKRAGIVNVSKQFWGQMNNKKWALKKMPGDNKENCQLWSQIGI